MTDTAQALALADKKLLAEMAKALTLSYELDETAKADAEEGAYAWVIAQGRRAAACIRYLVAHLEAQHALYDGAIDKLAKARDAIEERDRRIDFHVKNVVAAGQELAALRERCEVLCLSLEHALHVIQKCSSPEQDSTYGILCEEIEQALNSAALARPGGEEHGEKLDPKTEQALNEYYDIGQRRK